MRFTETWLDDPSELLAKNSGIKMWDTHAVVGRDGILSFCTSPGSASKVAAKLILAKNESGFGITLMSDTIFCGIQTHYEIPPVEQEFNMICVNDSRPDIADLYNPCQDEPVLELQGDPAVIVAWTMCKMINQKSK